MCVPRSITTSESGKPITLLIEPRTLVTKAAQSSYDASTTAAVVLATRYYKRIGGHVLNILSSVVMPLHKIDYYDEDSIPAELRTQP